jgi:radical SAM enzyme (rSAM/lipoprotein system)
MPFATVGRLGRRALHPAYRYLETEVHPLRYLFIEITQRCNLSCRHCGSDCTKDAQLDELSVEEWIAFLDDMPNQVDTSKLLLVVTGGEPLCAPGFPRILAALERNRLRWAMVSNGLALDARRLQASMAAGMVSLTISLDGLEASHNWLRGSPRSFAKALAAIRLAAASGLPFFDVVTCVNPRNLEELPQVMQLLRGAGVPAWRLFSIFPKGRAAENRDLILSDAELKRLTDWIAEQRAALGHAEPFRLQFSCEGYVPAAVDRAIRDEPYFCRAGISIGSILADGAISACPNISRALVQGNVREDSLAEVWQQRFGRFRDRSWMRRGRCSDCLDWSRCQGNSMHLWNAEAEETMRCFAPAVA